MAGDFKIAINNVCSVHDQELLYYCSVHDELLCKSCVKSDHQKCPPPASSADFANKSKESVSVNLERNVNIILENVKNALNYQRETLSTVSNKETEVKLQIQEMRNRINKKLDELEEQLLSSYVKKRDDYIPEIQSNINKFEKREHELEEIERSTSKIKEFGSNMDYFLAAQQVNEKILEEEEIIIDIIKNIRGVNVDFSMNGEIESFISKLSSIGDFVMYETQCPVKMKQIEGVKKKPVYKAIDQVKQVTNEDKHVHTTEDIQVDNNPGKIDVSKQNVVLRKKFEITKGFLMKELCICNGLVINEQIFFTDSENKRFIVTSIDGDHVHYMDVTGRPWGISTIDDSRVVVTFPYIGSGYLEILDILNNKVEKAIQIGGLCRGVSFNGGLIYVVVYGKGILVVDLEGNIKNDIKINVNGVFHITVDGDRIYFTDEWTHTLHCRDLSGKEIWSYSNDRLKEPQGITVDGSGNVYVASYVFDNVTVISADGQKHREILNKSDGLLGPSSLFYDKKKNLLLVSSRKHGRVSLYHVF